MRNVHNAASTLTTESKPSSQIAQVQLVCLQKDEPHIYLHSILRNFVRRAHTQIEDMVCALFNRIQFCNPMDFSPLSMGFSMQEFSRQPGLPCPPPGDLPHPGIKSRSAALQADFFFFTIWTTTETAEDMVLIDYFLGWDVALSEQCSSFSVKLLPGTPTCVWGLFACFLYATGHEDRRHHSSMAHTSHSLCI